MPSVMFKHAMHLAENFENVCNILSSNDTQCICYKKLKIKN